MRLVWYRALLAVLAIVAPCLALAQEKVVPVGMLSPTLGESLSAISGMPPSGRFAQADEQFLNLQQNCVSGFEKGHQNYRSLAQCLQSMEWVVYNVFPWQDMRDGRAAERLLLADKLQNGEITASRFDLEMNRVEAAYQTEMFKRRAANMSRGAR